MTKNNDKQKPKFEIIDKRYNRDEINNEIEKEEKEVVNQETEQKPASEPTSNKEATKFKSGESKTQPKNDNTESLLDTETSQEEKEFEEAMLSQLDIDVILQNTLSLAIQLAFVYLGMQPDPKTKLIQQNIGKASRTINFIDFCYQLYQSSFDDRTKSEISKILQILKMQFVQITQPINPNGGTTTN